MPFWTQIVQYKAPCPANLCDRDCSDIFLRFRRAPGAWNGGFGGSDFDKNRCSILKHHFCKNSRFASTRTWFSRFREPGSHAKIILNLMQNGTWQLTMSKTRKAKLWTRDFVLQGVCGTTCVALRVAQSRSKRHPSSLIRQISVPFLCSGSHWGCTRSIFAISLMDIDNLCACQSFSRSFYKKYNSY